MTDSTIPHDVLELAAEVRPADLDRITPPDEVWAGIEAALTTEPVSLATHRSRRSAPAWLLAAAAVLGIVGIVGALLQATDDGPTESVVATATIVNDGLQVANDGSGVARIVDVDGDLQLELDVPDLPATDGFYEVWIIDTDVEGMFSLGVVDGDGRFDLPDNVDPADFPVIDVSVEPLDGNPLHSGQSIWRGVLDVQV